MKKTNLIFTLILLILITSIKAQTYNETIEALNHSRIDLQEMIEAGFTVLKVNDTLIQAEQLFQAQYALQEAGGTPDFSLVLVRTNEISDLRKQAEEMSDELKALEARLKEVDYESETFAMLNESKREFADERYDNVAELVEEAYVKLAEEEALQTRFRAIYTAGTKTVGNFIKNKWKEILLSIILIIIAYLFLRKRAKIFLINRKIKNLSFEKEIVGKLIKNAQYEYFHLFKIPEELYHIRMEKFGELVRDIDRKVPLLVEERAKIEGKVKKEGEEKAKISYKKFIIPAIIFIIVIGIVLAVYFNIISYEKVLEFIRKAAINFKNGFYFIANKLGTVGLSIVIAIIIAVSSTAFAFIYINKKRKKEKPEIAKKAEEAGKERFKSLLKFLQKPKSFISSNASKLTNKLNQLNKLNKFNLFFKDLVRKAKSRKTEKKEKTKQEKQPKGPLKPKKRRKKKKEEEKEAKEENKEKPEETVKEEIEEKPKEEQEEQTKAKQKRKTKKKKKRSKKNIEKEERQQGKQEQEGNIQEEEK